MSDPLSFIFDFIKNLLGEVPSGQAIPYFAPFYNLLVILWMAAIAALFVALFWKRFRSFAAFLIWIAIFLTLIQRGSMSQNVEIDASSALFNISFSTLVLIIFIVLTLLIFSSLRRGKRVVPTPGWAGGSSTKPQMDVSSLLNRGYMRRLHLSWLSILERRLDHWLLLDRPVAVGLLLDASRSELRCHKQVLFGWKGRRGWRSIDTSSD